jgi:hypothetical protein
LLGALLPSARTLRATRESLTGAAIACSSASNSAILPGLRPAQSRRYSSSGIGNGAINRAPTERNPGDQPVRPFASAERTMIGVSGRRRDSPAAAADGGNLLLEPRHILIAQIAFR